MARCLNHMSPSSVLSPLLGMDADTFYSSPNMSNAIELVASSEASAESNAAPVICSSVTPASSSLKRALSSTSSLSTLKDRSATRARKRRKSRAKPKVPITQISANKLNFRDIVHEFTGASPSKRLSNQSSPQMPGTTENRGVVYDWQHMPSALAHASLSENDVLAGSLLAQSLKTLDTISSYILQAILSQDTPKEATNTQVMRGDFLNEHVYSACRPSVELRDFLLQAGDSKLDTLFSLSCLLLNQIASQCE